VSTVVDIGKGLVFLFTRKLKALDVVVALDVALSSVVDRLKTNSQNDWSLI